MVLHATTLAMADDAHPGTNSWHSQPQHLAPATDGPQQADVC